MKTFHCDHCGHLLFFENTLCLRCGRLVAYLPDLAIVGSLDPDRDRDTWRSPLAAATGRVYRFCRNYEHEQVCNWTVTGDDPNPLCVSCRLTQVIPDLGTGNHRQAWYRLEVAKRRLIFTLLRLRLPIVSRSEDPARGLAFELQADDPSGEPVLTGHAGGVITVNVAEADDAERERRRTSLHEPYRTLAGHFRHESGHYYWDRLIAERGAFDGFRQIFGDERPDYRAALQTHYADGPPADWQAQFISAYASAHPMEDWAETWSHYLHVVDTVETAAACGVSLQPRRADEPSLARAKPAVAGRDGSFDELIESWYAVTYLMNNLNRGLGLADAYPFVWSDAAIAKLRYVHDTIGRAQSAAG